MKPSIIVAAVLAALTLPAGAVTLDDVRSRGMVICGANGQLPGFGLPDAQGNWTGFDVDYCRAYAATIFNDPTKVKFVALTAKDRFTALQSGDVDVLARNTTWTSSRETQLGLHATGPNYYDGQGFIVRKSLKVNSALELSDASVCVQQGTTTELNLADFFRANRMKLKSVTFAQLDEALIAGGEATRFIPVGNYFQNYLLSNAEGVDFAYTSAATTLIILYEVVVSLAGVVVLGLGGLWWIRIVVVIGVVIAGVVGWLIYKFHGSGEPPAWIAQSERLRGLWEAASEQLGSFGNGAERLIHPRLVAVSLGLATLYLIAGAGVLYVSLAGIGWTKTPFGAVLAVYF